MSKPEVRVLEISTAIRRNTFVTWSAQVEKALRNGAFEQFFHLLDEAELIWDARELQSFQSGIVTEKLPKSFAQQSLRDFRERFTPRRIAQCAVVFPRLEAWHHLPVFRALCAALLGNSAKLQGLLIAEGASSDQADALCTLLSFADLDRYLDVLVPQVEAEEQAANLHNQAAAVARAERAFAEEQALAELDPEDDVQAVFADRVIIANYQRQDLERAILHKSVAGVMPFLASMDYSALPIIDESVVLFWRVFPQKYLERVARVRAYHVPVPFAPVASDTAVDGAERLHQSIQEADFVSACSVSFNEIVVPNARKHALGTFKGHPDLTRVQHVSKDTFVEHLFDAFQPHPEIGGLRHLKADLLNQLVEGRWAIAGNALQRLALALPAADTDATPLLGFAAFGLLCAGDVESADALCSRYLQGKATRAQSMLLFVSHCIAVLKHREFARSVPPVETTVEDRYAAAPQWVEVAERISTDHTQKNASNAVKIGDFADDMLKGSSLNRALATWMRALQSELIFRRGQFAYAKRTTTYTGSLQQRWLPQCEPLQQWVTQQIALLEMAED